MSTWLGRAVRSAIPLLAATLATAHLALPAGAQQRGGTPLLDRPARLTVQEVSREQALRALQRSSGVPFGFSPDLLGSGATVSCSCADVSVRQALDHILEGTGLRYLAVERKILVGPPASFRDELPKADRYVAGIAVDGSDGPPVPGADVELLPTALRTATDAGGRFLFRAVKDGWYRVRISALGYDTALVEVRVPSDAPLLRVELVRRPIPLSEIVIAPGQLGILQVAPATMGTSLTRQDIEAIPEFGDDAFRTLQRLPGVISDDLSTKLHLRGGRDRDVLVLLDGVELFQPYHLQDLDGALGIVDVQALGGIDLITGGFSPEFGDHTAGVMDMTTRRAPPAGVRNTVGMSLSSLSASSQGSFAGGKGQWLTSLRRGFLDIVLDIAGSADDLRPRYWDALGRLQYLAAPHQLVSFEILHAGDDGRWSDANDTGSHISSKWSNGYVWGTWKGTFFGRANAQTVLSYGRLSRNRVGSIQNPSDGVFTPLLGTLRDRASFDFTDLREDWSVDVSNALLLRAGVHVRRASGSYDFSSAATFLDLDSAGHVVDRVDSTVVDLAPSSTWTAAYASTRVRTPGALTWEAGVRYDRHTHTGDENVAPRVLVRWDAGRHTIFRGSWGDYYQTQEIQDLSVADSETTFSPAERARQTAVGVERDFGGGLVARLEGYRRNIHKPQPFFVNLAREINPILELESDRTRIDPTASRARGVEVIVSRRSEAPLSWSASYILAQSEDLVDGKWVPRTLDQRHTLNLMAEYRAGRAWQLSGLFQYHSGWPATDQTFQLVVTPDVSGKDGQITLVRREFGPMNADHLPAYQRLDLRATRAFDFRKSRLEVYLDVFNVFNRVNLKGYAYALRKDASRNLLFATREDGDTQLPRLPTLGFRWVF